MAGAASDSSAADSALLIRGTPTFSDLDAALLECVASFLTLEGVPVPEQPGTSRTTDEPKRLRTSSWANFALANRACRKAADAVLVRVAASEVAARLRAGKRVCNALCERVPDVIVPDGIAKICPWAFQGCAALHSIHLPGSVVETGNKAFDCCHGLTHVEIAAGPCGVPRRIGDNSFYGCCNLQSITLPVGIVSIGHQVFAACSALTSLELPDSLTEIGSCCFFACTNLASLGTVPASLTNLDSHCFIGCTLLEKDEAIVRRLKSINGDLLL